MSRLAPSTGERVVILPRMKLTPTKRLQVLLNGNGRCYLCQAKIADVFEIEHPIPHALGVPERLEDLRPVCVPCHQTKTRTQDIPQIAKSKRQEKLRLDVPRTKSAAWRGSRGFAPPRRVPAK